MRPTAFRSMTRNLGAPANWDEHALGVCVSLPIRDQVVDGLHEMVSCWKPTGCDVLRMLNGEQIWLKVVGRQHPVVWVFVEPKDL